MLNAVVTVNIIRSKVEYGFSYKPGAGELNQLFTPRTSNVAYIASDRIGCFQSFILQKITSSVLKENLLSRSRGQHIIFHLNPLLCCLDWYPILSTAVWETFSNTVNGDLIRISFQWPGTTLFDQQKVACLLLLQMVQKLLSSSFKNTWINLVILHLHTLNIDNWVGRFRNLVFVI